MMKHLSEGKKMFLSVMTVFALYAVVFIVFDDYDRRVLEPLNDQGDWNMLYFSIGVMLVLAWLLHRYARRMDERIGREQAEEQNKMRRQLTQNISHELKTPVTSIMGYTETLIDNPHLDDDTRQQFIARCHAQAARLASLLQDLSVLNRMDYAPEVIEMEPTDVSALVASIEADSAPRLGLAIVKNAVCLHGGTLFVGHGEEGGLCIKFTLKK